MYSIQRLDGLDWGVPIDAIPAEFLAAPFDRGTLSVHAELSEIIRKSFLERNFPNGPSAHAMRKPNPISNRGTES